MPSCTEEGCEVLVTGKCINDLEIDNCPHYSPTDTIVDDAHDEFDENGHNEKLESSTNVVDVYSGMALSLGEVNRISTSSLTRLIILAGLPDAGKTTLLLSLMHLFQTNTSFAGFLFAGSQTMLDFEEKSHPSKIASEKDLSETNRTPIGPPKFLHLKAAAETDLNKVTELLFTDISGELFIAIKDSTQEAKKFSLCQRADHFTLFFDSDRITSVKDRANTRASGLGILKSLNEAGSLQPHTSIQVIFSRWDLFVEKDNQPSHAEFIRLLKEDIISQFGNIYHIDFFEVSARPKNNILPFGFGIREVFPLWVEKSILDSNKLNKQSCDKKDLEKEFLKYQFNK